jgi:hypothetical protein
MNGRTAGVGDSGFRPGVEAARARGHKINVRAYPEGVAGIQMSLTECAKAIRNGRLDPDIRGWAGDILVQSGRPSSARAQAQAILDGFRSQVAYVADPVGAEYIASSSATLCLRPGVCVRAHDCFPEGTLLLRDDYELVPIEEIKLGDRIWGLDQWTKVQAHHFKGKLTTDTLILNNGSHVPLTRDHHVFVYRCDGPHVTTIRAGYGCNCPLERRRLERIAVGDAKPFDVLPRPARIPFGTGEPDTGRTYIEGLYASEGWEMREQEFAISGRDGHRKEALKHEVKAICERLGIPTRWDKKSIVVKDRAWTQQIAKLGTRARFKRARTLNLAEDAAKELLRGIMSDSTANTFGGGRTFSTTSDRLMVQARVLQRMFGRSTGVRYLTPHQHGGFGKHAMWRMQVWATKEDKHEKLLRIKDIERGSGSAVCYDITTEDGFVYLPQHDVTVSNCDDAVVAVGSALMSIGIPVVVVKQNFGSGQQEHVLLEAQDEQGLWFAVDPSTKLPVGSKHPALEEQRVDPMDQTGSTGTAGAEIVTLGQVPFGLGHAPGEACCSSCAKGEPCEGGCDGDFGLGRTRPELPQLYAFGHMRRYGLGDATTDWPPQVATPPLPPGSWQIDQALTAKQGLRYVVMLAAKGAWCPGIIDLACNWTETDATKYFERDWVIETLSLAQNLPSPSLLTSTFADQHRTLWLMRGIAKRDLQLSTTPGQGVSQPAVLGMWSEVPGSSAQGPVPAPGSQTKTPGPVTPGTVFWWALGGTTAALAVIGGLAWLEKRGTGSGSSSRSSGSRSTRPRLGPLHAKRLVR